MRLIFTILLFCYYASSATVYYVSNSGNNSNGGTQSAPFATLAKAMSMVSANDSVLLNKGDNWNEKITIPVSNLYIGSYGTGTKPLITGFQTVTGLTNSGNIWSATVSSAPTNLNTVLVNGALRAKGRYPNTSYLGQSGSTMTQLNGTSLTGTPNYTGGEVVVRPVHWILNKAIISSQSGATLNLASSLEYTPIGGYGFFIQNIPSVLDQEGEWCFNSTTKVLSIYSSSQPNVQGSVLDTLLSINNKSYITIDGIQFTGANAKAINIGSSSNHITVINCTINNTGEDGIFAAVSHYLTITNDSITNSLNNGTYLYGSNYALIADNYIYNSGMIPGMGMHGAAKYVGLYCGFGDAGIYDTAYVIRNNTVINSGYIGIMSFALNGLIKNNRVDSFCINKDDGSGIYTGWPGTIVRSNIVSNGIGAPVGATGQVIAPGIYFDDNLNECKADSNTIFNCVWAALFFHNNGHNTANDNLLIASNGYPLYETEGSSNKNYQRNILYSQSSSYAAFNHNNISATDTINNNYYLRPVQEANKWIAGGTTYSSLAAWRSATGYDANSQETPTGITTDAPLFYYNPTKSDSTITLANNYIDAKGGYKSSSITLKPFTSTLLFRAASIPLRKVSSIKILSINKL